MVERTTTLVDVTRDEPCPGRREELLSLAALREQSPTQASARRHVASCRRCAAFLSSVQLELRLGVDAFSELRARHAARTAPPFDLARSKSFTAWLEGELEERSELELARALTRAARYLHLLDPEVAAKVVVADDRPATLTSNVGSTTDHEIDCRAGLVSSLVGWLSKQPPVSRSAGALARDAELVASIQSCTTPAGSSARLRDEIALAVLDRAQEVAGGRFGPAWQLRGIIEWFSIDPSNVRRHFERATQYADAPNSRAICLVSLGVLSSDEGDDRSRYQFMSAALAQQPSPGISRSIHSTRMLWFAGSGRIDNALAELSAISRLGLLELTRRRTTPSIIRSTMGQLAVRYDVPRARVANATRQVIEALHGGE